MTFAIVISVHFTAICEKVEKYERKYCNTMEIEAVSTFCALLNMCNIVIHTAYAIWVCYDSTFLFVMFP